MKQFIIIVAGGSGLRMASEIPKQFLVLKDKPVLMHTINAFYSYNNDIDITLVLPELQINYWKSLVDEYSFNIKHNIVTGGETRFHSVKNGLKSINESEGIVGIHDGVRPLVSKETIQNTFLIAQQKGNAVPFIDIFESLRYVDESINKPVNRNNYKSIQTPQVFNLSSLKQAYNLEYNVLFTDDASVFEKAGHTINLVKGNCENIKITEPYDLKIANSFI